MPKLKSPRLNKPPQIRGESVYRTAPTRGVINAASTVTIDRDGGEYGAGLTQEAAIITRGEALGHYQWIDETFLDQTADAINNHSQGVRVRFAHPSLSADGIGRKLGKVTDAWRDGDMVRGDLHFTKASHTTPEGDLATYVMDMAAETPELFGISIVFKHDLDAEQEFAVEHGAVVRTDEFGEFLDMSDFKSPDPKNVENHAHVRLAAIYAADVVDSPAANPAGMFSAEFDSIPAQADQFMSYILGLSDNTPANLLSEDIDLERVRSYAARFLSEHHLSLIKDQDMSKTKLAEGAVAETAETEETATGTGTAGAETTETTETGETDGDESGDGEGETETATSETGETQANSAQDHAAEFRAELARYTAAFGAELGAAWFTEGIDWTTALTRHNSQLAEQNKGLQEQLTAAKAAAGEETPLSQNPRNGKGKTPPSTDPNDRLREYASAIDCSSLRPGGHRPPISR